MTGTMETMTMSDGATVAVYHAQPTGERRGGLVLVQEIFGVTDHIRDLCDEYAADGYEVLAPALFDREHPALGRHRIARGKALAGRAPLASDQLATCLGAIDSHSDLSCVSPAACVLASSCLQRCGTKHRLALG